MARAWSDQDIEPGEDWHRTIQDSLEQAVAVVLMVSPEGYSRAKAFSALLPRLANEIAQDFWQKLLAALTCRICKEFDEDTPKLEPAIVAPDNLQE